MVDQYGFYAARLGTAGRVRAGLDTAGLGPAGQGKARVLMPKKRPPREVWRELRVKVWERDQGLCQYPLGKHPVPLEQAHIDHIKSGKLGTNALTNLRTLCRTHHALRADHRHRGLIWKALREGIISPNWREQVWEEQEIDVPDNVDTL